MRYPVALKQNAFCYLAVALMAVAIILRCAYFLPRWAETDALTLALQFFLPLLSGLVYCGAMLAKGGKLYLLTILSVFLGITFFIVKAQGFAHAWHTVLCTLLYLVVFIIYTLTALGVMPSLFFQKLVFGLPLIFHLAQDIFFPSANMQNSPLPELSVLCIMAALLLGTFALQTIKTGCRKDQ